MVQYEALCRTFLFPLCIFMSVCLRENSGQLNITVHPGQNMTLPCQAPVSKHFIAVEWTRPDLTPSQYVFFVRGGRIHNTFQHPSFVNRVDLLDRPMKDGNVSLILRNVNSSDHGTYECRVKERERRRMIRGFIKSEPINVIRLTVTDSDLIAGSINKADGGIKDGHVGLAVGLSALSLLLVAFGAGGFVMYKKRTMGHSYTVPAEQADETVM
ncbi:Selection and upkeep of intraepithelial T-cells protein 7 [Channa argus]|uniref:Selection and upkeep of intraepithelial T-cells protein 7 n=2 Tax=Channa argus TaxID=215402 RepID=A0A6G1Q6R8_CHAAH|nr:Selection and upkeep of intraepithelial T-cells protein 7 [Channa argus]